MHSLRLSFYFLAKVLILQSFQIPCNAASQCYYPNGREADDFPCDPDAEVSACCGGSLGSVCLNNMLCRSPEGNTIRGSCTDGDWGEGCPLYCTGASTGGTDLISCSNVTDSDTSYCCDHARAGCCDGGVGRFNVLPSNPTPSATWNVARSQFIVVATSTSSSISITTSSSTSSVSSTSTTTSSTTIENPATVSSSSISPTSNTVDMHSTASPSPTGMTKGEKVGIGVGVGLGAVLLAALAYLVWFLWKKSRTLKQQPSQEPLPELSPEPISGTQPNMAYGYYAKEAPPQELSTEPKNTDHRYELPATYR